MTEFQYKDHQARKHDLQIFEGLIAGENVYTIHRDGDFFIDLVYDQDTWIEVYSGKTDRSVEYGRVIESILKDRKAVK